MLKRILAAVMSVAMAFTLSSCEKKENNQAPETTADGKKIVKIYAWYIEDKSIYSHINDFNSKNSEYEVQLTEYIDFEEPLTRLNADITTGNPPDILVTAQAMPMESYISKGMIADLYEFIDSDPDMSREDFLGSIFRSNERDGRLCKLTTDFYIQTLIGKTSLIGDRQGMSTEEFIELADKYPDKQIFADNITKGEALYMFTNFGYSSYIDRSIGKCSFDSEAFINLLEFCNSFPAEFLGILSEAEQSSEVELRKGTILLSYGHILMEFEQIRFFEQYVFGEPVTFAGFPGMDGHGAVFYPSTEEFSVFENSPVKEGAWEFLKYYLSEEYQDKVFENGNNFPVRMSSLEKLAEEAKKEREENPFGANTDEDNRRIFDLLDSAAGAMNFDKNIYFIIEEEAEAYFSGQKSSREAAEIIQNRVQNYIDENR